MPASISRRTFLKLAGAAALGLAFRPIPGDDEPFRMEAPGLPYGRATRSMYYYDEPSFSGNKLGYYNTDAVFRVFEQVIGDPEPVHNPIWFRSPDGWLHSSDIQPVDRVLNQTYLDVPAKGFLGEVTVPFTEAYKPGETRKRVYRLYYSSTYWVKYAFLDARGQVWYQVYDDLIGELQNVQGAHLRRVPDEELAPISPGVPDKHIFVDLPAQRVTAFEGDQPVFTTRAATGFFGTQTPIGTFRVERKQPSRHMAQNIDPVHYDLPGVPWCCFISWTGVSLHGTYWHNDYGQPQSHGCINLPPQAAKWIYRWTDPIVPPDEDFVGKAEGTQVVVS